MMKKKPINYKKTIVKLLLDGSDEFPEDNVKEYRNSLDKNEITIFDSSLIELLDSEDYRIVGWVINLVVDFD